MRRSLWVLVPAAGLFVAPLPASAHLVSTGLGPVYDGIFHFALTPEEVLPMAALALFAGMRGPAHARQVLFVLPVAWLSACLAAIELSAEYSPIVSAISLLALGTLLAADAKVSPLVIAVISIVLGVALGGFYGLHSGTEAPGLTGAVGAAGYAFVLVALLSSVSLPFRWMSARIAVRVAGSWTAALGLLLVGWWIHGRP
jgi:HupE/UreJ protein